MALDPTDAELQGFRNVGNVATWCGLGGMPTDRSTPRGSLFALLGLDGSEHPRVVGISTEAKYTVVLNGWRLGADASTDQALHSDVKVDCLVGHAGSLQVPRHLCTCCWYPPPLPPLLSIARSRWRQS